MNAQKDMLRNAEFSDRLNAELNEFAAVCYANGMASEQEWTPAVHAQFKTLSQAIELEFSTFGRTRAG